MPHTRTVMRGPGRLLFVLTRLVITGLAITGLAIAGAMTGCGATAGHPTSVAASGDPLDAVSPAELFRRGQILAQHGDLVRAEQYLLAARDRGFEEARVIPMLMDVCVRASRLSAATGYAEPYLESHPSDWPLRILVGSIHLGLGHLGEARAHLERAIADGSGSGRPEPAEAHYLLGIVLREQAELVLARTHFARYAELEPTGSHTEEVTAILAEPLPHQATPIPPAVRPATVPVRLPSPGATEPASPPPGSDGAASGTANGSSSGTTETAGPTGAANGGAA